MDRRSFFNRSFLGLLAGFLPFALHVQEPLVKPLVHNGARFVPINKASNDQLKQALEVYNCDFISQETMREIYENTSFNDCFTISSVHLLHS